MPNYGVVIDTEMLRAARRRKGWTVREVAEQCMKAGTKVDFSNYARYEHGQRLPSPKTLVVIAKVLGLDFDDLASEPGVVIRNDAKCADCGKPWSPKHVRSCANGSAA